jgi:hypothetical protein
MMVRRVLTLVIVALTALLAGPSTAALGSSAYRYDESAAAALHFGDPGATSTTPSTNGEGGSAGATTDSAGASRGKAVALRLGVAAEDAGKAGFDLFHGTDVNSASDIIENGISRNAAARYGGDGQFYTTTSRSDAEFFARANPAEGPPALVGIRLPGGVDQAVAQALLEPFGPLPGAYTVSDFERFNAFATFGRAG